MKNLGAYIVSACLATGSVAYATSLNGEHSESEENACRHHPTEYLNSLEKRQTVFQQIAQGILVRMDGRSWSRFVSEIFANKPSFELSLADGSFFISPDPTTQSLRATRIYGEGNAITFEVSTADRFNLSSHNPELDFKIHPLLSSIDGVQFSHLLVANRVMSLHDTLMSNCWRSFIETKGTLVASHPSDPSEGDGSFTDPFKGPHRTAKTTGWCVNTYKLCLSLGNVNVVSTSLACEPPFYITAKAQCGSEF
ncbi:hypothetical protein C6Y40_00330 [Alteromonas alba]|uniref:Uncharacterized protein n=1 Tax=Alteromonas alba TaxID=2079529 RepID=A0A2S9VGI4_9ALTE|nr:hypothetical protein [Alteromonas alba]PRO75581.1 hypothetical protein C6Y40_00330 [Alteromonas alba]